MIEEKLKRIVGKAYERWIARIRDVDIQDDALNLSCLDRFHDFFPLLSIRRTDELLKRRKILTHGTQSVMTWKKKSWPWGYAVLTQVLMCRKKMTH